MGLKLVNPSDVEIAFPTGQHTPPWEEIPEEFQKAATGGTPNRWVSLVQALFNQQRDATKMHLLPKEGVVSAHAWRMMCETLGTWGIQHEHKMAACGYILSEFFSEFWFDQDGSNLDKWYQAETAKQEGER